MLNTFIKLSDGRREWDDIIDFFNFKKESDKIKDL